MNIASKDLSATFLKNPGSGESIETGINSTQASFSENKLEQKQFWQIINQQISETPDNKLKNILQEVDSKEVIPFSDMNFLSENNEESLASSLIKMQDSELFNQTAIAVEITNNQEISLENNLSQALLQSPVDLSSQSLISSPGGNLQTEGGIVLPAQGQILPVVDNLPRQHLVNQHQIQVQDINSDITELALVNKNLIQPDLQSANKDAKSSMLFASGDIQLEAGLSQSETEEQFSKILGQESKEFQQKDFVEAFNQSSKVSKLATAEAVPTGLAVNALSAPSASQPVSNLQQAITGEQTLHLSPQASATQWGDGIGEKLQWMINQKNNSAEIRIDPPHLGKLDIQISIREDVASISITTHNSTTQELVEAASFRLKEFLQQAGYSQVDVDVSQQQEQQMAERQERNNNANEQESSDLQHAAVPNGQNYASDSLVDFFA